VPVWPPRLAYLYAHGDTRGLSVRKATVSEEQGLRTLREDQCAGPGCHKNSGHGQGVPSLRFVASKKVSDLT
jgi:hypothetical protein